MALRGLRGAITVEENSQQAIWQAAQLLITKLLSANEVHYETVGAIIFSSTKDLTAAFPTAGVRQLPNFQYLPLFDTVELDIEGSMPMCLRVLVLADIDKSLNEVCHVYLGDAKKLRPDISY
ncbi:MAG: chorismate mutase [Selenomonadaceae bacterium]|nr:chorismate mutase [Selenomonadaceae bacterium]